MTKLVFLRHGESSWNREDRFAGWMDVSLTSAGIAQAANAGKQLRECGFEFDVCYTSVLRRATHTAWHCLNAMDRTWLPMCRSWHLNERHYGALHGLSKRETTERFGSERVRLWRRSYAVRPPEMAAESTARLQADPRYARVAVPRSESQEDAFKRVRTFWECHIRDVLTRGSLVLVVGHGTTGRALLAILAGRAGEGVAAVEVPNGVPIVFDLDRQQRAVAIRLLDGKAFF
jgi:2,3-bisphosphoglycerate-dependent phosphoglycerate mutase